MTKPMRITFHELWHLKMQKDESRWNTINICQKICLFENSKNSIWSFYWIYNVYRNIFVNKFFLKEYEAGKDWGLLKIRTRGTTNDGYLKNGTTNIHTSWVYLPRELNPQSFLALDTSSTDTTKFPTDCSDLIHRYSRINGFISTLATDPSIDTEGVLIPFSIWKTHNHSKTKVDQK